MESTVQYPTKTKPGAFLKPVEIMLESTDRVFKLLPRLLHQVQRAQRLPIPLSISTTFSHHFLLSFHCFAPTSSVQLALSGSMAR